jgi:hypothetical protein
MEDLISEQVKVLLDEKQQNNMQYNEKSICLRFIQKKYKCIMLWMLSIIAFSQLLIIIFDKLFNQDMIDKLSIKLNKILFQSSNNSTRKQ